MPYRIDINRGVFGTSRSLRLSGGSELKTTATGSRKRSSSILAGPRYALYYPSRPSRVSYFVRFGNNRVNGELEDVSGGMFALHDMDFSNSDETVIGLGVVNGRFRHGANVQYAMNLQSHSHHHMNHVSQDHENHSRVSSESESEYTNEHNHHHRSFSEDLPHTDRVLRGRWYVIFICARRERKFPPWLPQKSHKQIENTPHRARTPKQVQDRHSNELERHDLQYSYR